MQDLGHFGEHHQFGIPMQKTETCPCRNSTKCHDFQKICQAFWKGYKHAGKTECGVHPLCAELNGSTHFCMYLRSFELYGGQCTMVG